MAMLVVAGPFQITVAASAESVRIATSAKAVVVRIRCGVFMNVVMEDGSIRIGSSSISERVAENNSH